MERVYEYREAEHESDKTPNLVGMFLTDSWALQKLTFTAIKSRLDTSHQMLTISPRQTTVS